MHIKELYEVIIIGAGPAGLAAALSAHEQGAKDILLLERNDGLGGILNQCIHNGFGLHYFKEELTGPEYAERFINELQTRNITVLTGAMALDISPERTVHFIQAKAGWKTARCKALILAAGCRERTRGALGITGSRPSGVFTAGTAQLFMNIEGYALGKRAVILGSGDIGLIMARRLTLEGAQVLGVFEIQPYSSGLTRNLVQCLEDYHIPLHLSRTIVRIEGERRLERVVVSDVDSNRRPIPGTEETIDCDMLLISAGLIPEKELSGKANLAMDRATGGPILNENMETSVSGIFACGNVAHVHDLVDFVSAESMRAGKYAALYAQKGTTAASADMLNVRAGAGVGSVVPQRIRRTPTENTVELFFRVTAVFKKAEIEVHADGNLVASFKREHLAPGEMENISLSKEILERTHGELTVSVKGEVLEAGAPVHLKTEEADGRIGLVCIVCPKGCRLLVEPGADYTVTGHSCERGKKYGKREIAHPERVVTSTVRIQGADWAMLPVKTDKPVPKEKIFGVVQSLKDIVMTSPVAVGTVVLQDVCGTGANVVATRSL